MISGDDKKIVLKIHELLKHKFSMYAGLYFYGSRLSPNKREDSDYDIVVTFNKKIDWQLENAVWSELALFELENEIHTDVKIYEYSELNKQNTPYRENVIKTGVFYGV